jgi:hypothetical protein
MKKNHLKEVIAANAVVKELFLEFTKHGKEVLPEALGVVAIVDSWLAGEAQSAESLQVAAESCENPLEQNLAVRWLATASYNLAWLTKTESSSKKGTQSIIEAATNALSQLGVDGNQAFEKFSAVYQKSLATVTNPKPGKVVKKAKALKLSPDELSAFLTSRNYASNSHVIAFDVEFGGRQPLSIDDPEAGEWILGAYACLTSNAHLNPRGRADWVPIAYSPNDVICYIDSSGSVWAVDTIEGFEGIISSSVEGFLKKIFGSSKI